MQVWRKCVSKREIRAVAAKACVRTGCLAPGRWPPVAGCQPTTTCVTRSGTCTRLCHVVAHEVGGGPRLWLFVSCAGVRQDNARRLAARGSAPGSRLMTVPSGCCVSASYPSVRLPAWSRWDKSRQVTLVHVSPSHTASALRSALRLQPAGSGTQTSAPSCTARRVGPWSTRPWTASLSPAQQPTGCPLRSYCLTAGARVPEGDGRSCATSPD